jgi:toxin-antitoxin system PIN domain toxin
VKVVDANVLLYAVNSDAAHHVVSRAWLDRSAEDDVVVGFSWLAMIAFVRLATKSNVFERPLTVDEAWDQIDAWLAQPNAVVVEPGAEHTGLMRRLLRSVGSAGNLVNDAHLAALAVERRGQVVSFDVDFARFAGVRWELPT